MAFTCAPHDRAAVSMRTYPIRSAPSVVKFVMKVAMTIAGTTSRPPGIMDPLNQGIAWLALVGGLAAGGTARATEPPSTRRPATLPPPTRVEYASYGVSLGGDALIHPGEICAIGSPCILGGGGGLGLRGGYRWAGPWYLGGVYQVSRTDSSNLYRLPTLQQLRVELRYMFELGYRTVPYVSWGGGGVVYGNEFGVETGGGTVSVGGGFEVQLSRLAILGLAARYQPMLFAGFLDTAGYERPLGVAHYAGLELLLEVRREVSGR
jgi:hypothetical protein